MRRPSRPAWLAGDERRRGKLLPGLPRRPRRARPRPGRRSRGRAPRRSRSSRRWSAAAGCTTRRPGTMVSNRSATGRVPTCAPPPPQSPRWPLARSSQAPPRPGLGPSACDAVNDVPSDYGDDLDRVMQALVRQGVTTVIWVTMQERRPLYRTTNAAITRRGEALAADPDRRLGRRQRREVDVVRRRRPPSLVGRRGRAGAVPATARPRVDVYGAVPAAGGRTHGLKRAALEIAATERTLGTWPHVPIATRTMLPVHQAGSARSRRRARSSARSGRC